MPKPIPGGLPVGPPLETIHVSQAGGFGRTVLNAADAGVPALGYVTEYADLLLALRTAAHDLLTAQEAPARCTVHDQTAWMLRSLLEE